MGQGTKSLVRELGIKSPTLPLVDDLLAGFDEILHLGAYGHFVVVADVEQAVHGHIFDGAGMNEIGVRIALHAAIGDHAKA